MDAVKVKATIDKAFATLEALPVVRRLPHWKKALEKWHAEANGAVDKIAATIPAGSPTNVIIDAVFAYLETLVTLPWEKMVLEAIRIALDALLAPVPAL